jgi:hypothetical protein
LVFLRTVVVPAVRVGFSSHSGGAGRAHPFFLHLALDSDPRKTLLLVAAHPVSGAPPAAWGSGGGFRRADEFEVVRACDRSRMLEYGAIKTRV